MTLKVIADSIYRGESIEFYKVENFCREKYKEDIPYRGMNFYSISDAMNFINSKVNNDKYVPAQLNSLEKMFNVILKYEMKTDNLDRSVIWQLSKEEIIIYRGEN